MKKLFAILALLVVGVTVALAQASPAVNNFIFDSSSAITSWNGSDPANPPYPNAMGAVSLNSPFGGGYGSAIDVPFQLGYLNNGYLSPCDPLVWGQKTYTIGDGTHDGDTFTVPGSTSCPYFTGEYGTFENSDHRVDSWSVVVSYVVRKKTTCGRYRCVTYFISILQGGTGTITETTTN